MDTLEHTKIDDFDGKLPVHISDDDLRDLDVEIEEDTSEDNASAPNSGDSDASDADADTFADASQAQPDAFADTSKRETVSRETSYDAFDPNSDAMREQRLREQEARERLNQEYHHAGQLLQAEVQKFDAERSRAEAYHANVESEIQRTRRALVQAIDDEDASAQLELQDTLQKLNEARMNIVAHYNSIPTQEQVADRWNGYWQERQREISSKFQSHVPTPQNDTAKAWQQKNTWMFDPGNKAAVADLIRINDELVSQGYDASAHSFYREMASRLAAKHPNLPLKDHTGRAMTRAAGRAKGPSGPPVASARTATASPNSQMRRSASGKPVVTLSPADMAIMRSMRRDPKDPANKDFVKRYAREKFASQQRQQK